MLNPGGVRIGTAEIYAAVESMTEVAEALAVGWQHGVDEEVVLFVRLTGGSPLDDSLVARIRNRVRERATARHRPAKVFQVEDIPRTRSGKIAELAVKNVLNDRPVDNLQALANPNALESFRRIRRLDLVRK